MHILDKLKKLDLSKVEYPELKSLVEKALKNYENKDSLLPIEMENYTTIYQMVETHFPEATGIVPVLPQPQINADELLSSLKNNKRIKGI